MKDAQDEDEYDTHMNFESIDNTPFWISQRGFESLWDLPNIPTHLSDTISEPLPALRLLPTLHLKHWPLVQLSKNLLQRPCNPSLLF
jgi:hypothetical protein